MNDGTNKNFNRNDEDITNINQSIRGDNDGENFIKEEEQKVANDVDINNPSDPIRTSNESVGIGEEDKTQPENGGYKDEVLEMGGEQSLIDETRPSHLEGDDDLKDSSQDFKTIQNPDSSKNFEADKSMGSGYQNFENQDYLSSETQRKNSEDPKESDNSSYYYERVYQPSKSPKGRGLLGTLAMVLIGAVLGSALTMATGNYLYGDKQIVKNNNTIAGNSVAQQSKPTPQIVTAPPADTGVTAENKVASEVTPSVVGITTRTKVQQPMIFGQGGGTGYVDGVGSGVIVSADGYIVTNAHVVDNGEATQIQVVFSDETTANGEVLWSDAALDLAIVKTDRTGLIPVEIGSSDAVKVGDKAIAIGNPLGMDLQSTLTSGYVSGLDRSITIQTGGTMSGLIQTDAAINEGNSGGALLNSAGQLIGINTAKAGGSVSGIGFAIPIDTAKPIISKVMAEGTFKSVYIGITGLNVSIVKAQDQTLKYDGNQGVYVMEVMKGTAAAEAGLQSADIITAIDEHEVNGMTDLKKALLNYQVGDEVEVTFYRNNEKTTKSLVFAQDSSNIEEFQNQEQP